MGNTCARKPLTDSIPQKRNGSQPENSELRSMTVESENLLNSNAKISKDDFKIIKVIGRGTFGKVFMVKLKENNMVYAMKVLKKEQVASRNLRVKTKAERDILEKIKNPYIVDLHYAFQTEDKLYFVMDFLNGGELDLKPENIILDSDGNLKITDFGLSKQGLDKQNDKSKTYSFCGTPEYLAPEIITGEGHDKASDWWSLGALIYEMLSGRPPHYQKNRKQMMADIVEKRIEMKPYFSVEAKSLLSGLLERDPSKRLGSGEEDALQIKRHPFFAKIDFQKLYDKQIAPPFKPTVSGPEDTRNIDKMFLDETAKDTPAVSNLSPDAKKKNHFDEFTYQGNNGGVEGLKFKKK
ncbi:protein kinase domain containing protein [Stylonychia lemnae]|uniref:Protein kinase domain containing protein n=1 Tax=Stylonychia lemnae TaxID=5949 RepID=A0A077ZVK0_STYLE|nr:protein kinase domain containing protein [Stylonychia lemnae]|eukprot:CDW73649.1 protein kinase domain containing protein [Stylonychia lemnae]